MVIIENLKQVYKSERFRDQCIVYFLTFFSMTISRENIEKKLITCLGRCVASVQNETSFVSCRVMFSGGNKKLYSKQTRNICYIFTETPLIKEQDIKNGIIY